MSFMYLEKSFMFSIEFEQKLTKNSKKKVGAYWISWTQKLQRTFLTSIVGTSVMFFTR